MPTDALVTVLGLVLVAVIGYLGLERYQARKTKAETAAIDTKTPLEAESLSVESMRIVITSLREQVADQKGRIDHLEERERELLAERDELRDEVERLSTEMKSMQERLAQLADRITPPTD